MPAEVDGNDLREDLVSAMEQVDTAPAPAETLATPEPVEAKDTPDVGETPTVESKDERPRDEKGRFIKADGTPSEPIHDKVRDTPLAAPEKAVAPPVPASPPTPEVVKAPASFKALAREDWGKTPASIQQEVLRRERETAMALEQSSEARQHHQKFREMVAPYEGLIRAQGSEPYVAINSLLQTAAALSMGPPQQKAAVLANLIHTYLPGEESLKMLDSTLAGVLQGGQSPNLSVPAQQYMRDPRIDEIYQTLQQARTQQQQTLEQQAEAAIREVQGNEFYEDVKLIMADLLEVAGNQGIALTPSEAYNRAVVLHPEVSKVVEQRNAAKHAANPTGSTARARAAASSVKGSPAAGPPPAQSDDIRSILEAQFDRHSA